MKTIRLTIILLAFTCVLIIFLIPCNQQAGTPSPASESAAPRISLTSVDTIPNSGPHYSYFWDESMQFIKLPIKKKYALYSGFYRDDHFIALADFALEQKLDIYNVRTGSTATIFLPHTNYVDMEADPENDRILLADINDQKIDVFTMDGQPLNSIHTGFPFLRFAHDPVTGNFIFYMVNHSIAISDGLQHTIIITDKDLKPLHRLFPLTTSHHKYPQLNSTRFNKTNQCVYYNPELTGEIYKINFNGQVELILDITEISDDFQPQINTILQEENTDDAFKTLEKIIPIGLKWNVTDDFIIIGNHPGKPYRNLIIHRPTMKAISVANGILIQNFGDRFNFAFRHPQFSGDDFMYSLYTAGNFNSLLNYVFGISTPEYLPDPINENEIMLVEQKPNLELFNLQTPQDRPSKPVDIYIHPNPAKDKIEISSTLKDGAISVRITSLNGKTMYQQKYEDPSSHTVDISSWPSGSYIATFRTNQQLYSKSFVVR